jgi:hypothetical protein
LQKTAQLLVKIVVLKKPRK